MMSTRSSKLRHVSSHSGRSTTSTEEGAMEEDQSIVLSDGELMEIAIQTKHSINWRDVMLSARFGPSRWQRENQSSDFGVWTRHRSQRFEVLAVGLVSGSVDEILHVLQSPCDDQHAQHMAAVFENDFENGAILHRVALDNHIHRHRSELTELTVKHVSFHKAKWLATHDKWCYIDAVHRHVGKTEAVEKWMTTVPLTDVYPHQGNEKTNFHAFDTVVCGYLLRPGAEDKRRSNHTDETPQVTRVSFYASFQIPMQVGFSLAAMASKRWGRSVTASDKTVKQRLLKLAYSTAQLTPLVRRQRLGLQTLMDITRFKPPMNAPCKVCTRMLMVAKLCRVCGRVVCGDCSSKQDRARQSDPHNALVVSRIRVCVNCLECIDSADYTRLRASSVLGRDAGVNAPESLSTSVRLQYLFHDLLGSAPSPSYTASVKSVTDYLYQDDDRSRRIDSTPVLPRLHRRKVDPIVLLDHRSEPLATNETLDDIQLETVHPVHILEPVMVIELEILCTLAAREMGCAMAAIALVDRDEFYSVASNVPMLRGACFPQTPIFCPHAIMNEPTPLVIVHPEADIRFSQYESLRAVNARFYCASPLLGADNQAIGALCCLHNMSIDVTKAQLAMLQKLASTVSKVVEVVARHCQ